MIQPRHYPGEMISRMPSGAAAGQDLAVAPGLITAASLRPAFDIIIDAADGTRLLRMYEDEQGRLQCEGDESRWGEAAMRFLHGMMTWSGQVGIPWKEEVRKAMGADGG